MEVQDEMSLESDNSNDSLCLLLRGGFEESDDEESILTEEEEHDEDKMLPQPKAPIIIQRFEPETVLTPPQRVICLNESKRLYPDCPHSWLCDGKLLHLHEPLNSKNKTLFQVRATVFHAILLFSLGKAFLCCARKIENVRELFFHDACAVEE